MPAPSRSRHRGGGRVGLALALSFTATVAIVTGIYKVFPMHPPGWRATRRPRGPLDLWLFTANTALLVGYRLARRLDQASASDHETRYYP